MHEQEQKQIFDNWLNQHKGILFKIVRAYAFNAHDRDDLFQEIALQLWRSIPDFRGEAKVSTWIYRVALYTASAWTRREKKQPSTEPLVAMAQTLTVMEQPSDARVEWLYEQIARLDPIDRSLCLLMLDGFSYKEMAEMLGISEGNVGVKIHRIKKRLVGQVREGVQHGH
ncbi:MAG: RNA polymerase sigma factor [Chloroflexota bacterium]